MAPSIPPSTLSKIRKPTSSITRRRARPPIRIELGSTTGTPIIVYSATTALTSNLDLARARASHGPPGSAQVSARARTDPNTQQMETTGPAPAAAGEAADRITQAMRLLSLEREASAAAPAPAPAVLPSSAELDSYQNPQAGLHEAIQTALGALHKLVVAREMMKSAGLQTPVYAGEEMADAEEGECVGLKYGRTASGVAVDGMYGQAQDGVQSALTVLMWVKTWLDEERSKVLATIVQHGYGF